MRILEKVWVLVKKILKSLGFKSLSIQRVRIEILKSIRRGDIKLILTPQVILENIFHIYLSDESKSAIFKCNYYGWKLEFTQSPAISLFGDNPFTFTGIQKPGKYSINFRGVNIDWFKRSGVWAPTIDSYILVSELIDSWPNNDLKVWEVGCGSGIIGLHLLQLTSCNELLMTDIDPRALDHASFNMEQMGAKNVNLRLEEFPPKTLPATKFDLLVCNPPYFPPGFLLSSTLKYEVKTTDHLSINTALLDIGPLCAKRVVFGFSSVILDEIMEHLKKIEPTGIHWKILRKVRLPLNAGKLNEDKIAIAGVFTTGPSDKFDLWHDLYIIEVMKE